VSSTQGELQKAFKTLSDPTRVRILRLLEGEELVVQELMEVLRMAQSRVSRHLAILREAGLLQDRRDGTYVWYRFGPLDEGCWADVWALVVKNLENDPLASRDAAALERVLAGRASKSRSFFDAVGPEWDALRKVFNDDALRARAISRLVPPKQKVADVGIGTGILAVELTRLDLDVIGIDHSSRMLEAAQSKFAEQGITNVELRKGDVGHLPLADDEVDGAFAHMVLHYVPSPADAVREMARVTRPGGVVVTVDFVAHSQEWMRQELGVSWLGFPLEEVPRWFEAAGIREVRIEVSEPHTQGRDLPETFIASGRLPKA
jgi:ubiquinone/menaquinone biosynthesis C-methylase UbiE/DNA-binding transcriptional ArsR family regulator